MTTGQWENIISLFHNYGTALCSNKSKNADCQQLDVHWKPNRKIITYKPVLSTSHNNYVNSEALALNNKLITNIDESKQIDFGLQIDKLYVSDSYGLSLYNFHFWNSFFLF